MDAKEELYDYVSTELSALSRLRGYPINPRIGLKLFFKAFRNYGFEIKNHLNSFDIFLTIKYSDNPDMTRKVSVNISKETVLNGDSKYPKGAPIQLVNSISVMHKSLNNLLSAAEQQALKHEMIINALDLINIVNNHLLEYINLYQENILMPVSGKIPELTGPKLFSRILKQFDLSIYEASRREVLKDTTVLRSPKDQINDLLGGRVHYDSEAPNYPSISIMKKYFFGLYLNVLTREKGYELKDDHDRLAQLAEKGWTALKEGRELWKRNF